MQKDEHKIIKTPQNPTKPSTRTIHDSGKAGIKNNGEKHYTPEQMSTVTESTKPPKSEKKGNND